MGSFPCSGCCKELAPGQKQIRQGCQPIDLAAVLDQAAQPGSVITELLLRHPADFAKITLHGCSTLERMCALLSRADLSFPLEWFGQGAAFAGALAEYHCCNR